MDELRLYKSLWRSVKVILFCLPFIILAACALWINPGLLPSEFALYMLFFFGVITLRFLLNAFDRRPQVIINETGVYNRRSGNDFINWDIIDHAYWKIAYGQRYVCLIIKDEFKPLIKIDDNTKQLVLATGLQEINIKVNNIGGVSVEKLNALIVMLKDAKPLDRSKLIVNGNSLKS